MPAGGFARGESVYEPLSVFCRGYGCPVRIIYLRRSFGWGLSDTLVPARVLPHLLPLRGTGAAEPTFCRMRPGLKEFWWRLSFLSSRCASALVESCYWIVWEILLGSKRRLTTLGSIWPKFWLSPSLRFFNKCKSRSALDLMRTFLKLEPVGCAPGCYTTNTWKRSSMY